VGLERVRGGLSGPLTLSEGFWKRGTFLTSALTQNKPLELLPDRILSLSLLNSHSAYQLESHSESSCVFCGCKCGPLLHFCSENKVFTPSITFATMIYTHLSASLRQTGHLTNLHLYETCYLLGFHL